MHFKTYFGSMYNCTLYLLLLPNGILFDVSKELCLFIILQAYVSNPIRNIDIRRNLKLEFILNHPYYKF